MKTALKVLRLYRYYFSWQRTMTVTSCIGIALLILGLIFISHRIKFLPIFLGVVLALVFPTVFAGVAFRILVSNKRLLLVPQLRSIAAAAMLLLALTDGLAAGALAGMIAPAAGTLAVVPVGAVVFALVSIHLLFTQWLVTLPIGLLAVFVSPMSLAYLTAKTDLIRQADLTMQWLIPVLAMAGWVWLFKSARGALPPTRTAAMQWGSSLPVQGIAVYRQVDGIGSPGGTLMRGASDSWASRISSTVSFLITFLCIILIVVFIIRRVGDGGAQHMSVAYLALLCTFFGFLAKSSAGAGEWPARLRLLWLRVSGDRQTAWRRIERALIEDTAIIGAVASLIAIGCLMFSDVRPLYLLIYVAACIAMNLFNGYLAFWNRVRGWPPAVPQMVVAMTTVIIVTAFVLMRPEAFGAWSLWLFPAIAALTLALRLLALRKLLRVDWCAVRPTALKKGA